MKFSIHETDNIKIRKEYFTNVDGYKNINSIISGDDDLLMHKIIKTNKCKIRYILSNDSYVYSNSPKSIKEFIKQGGSVEELVKYSFSCYTPDMNDEPCGVCKVFKHPVSILVFGLSLATLAGCTQSDESAKKSQKTPQKRQEYHKRAKNK